MKRELEYIALDTFLSVIALQEGYNPQSRAIVEQKFFQSSITPVFNRIQLENVIVSFDIYKGARVADIHLLARTMYREPGNIDDQEIKRICKEYTLDFQHVSNHPVDCGEYDVPIVKNGCTFVQWPEHTAKNHLPLFLNSQIMNLGKAQQDFDDWLDKAHREINDHDQLMKDVAALKEQYGAKLSFMERLMGPIVGRSKLKDE